jgi:hypothetical protein
MFISFVILFSTYAWSQGQREAAEAVIIQHYLRENASK